MSITIKLTNHHKELEGNYILVLTSNSVERAAVKKLLRNRCDADIGRDTRGCDIGFIADRLAVHLTGDSGISKLLSVGRIAQAFLGDPHVPKPALVLLVGFCWGNPEKTSVGSMIVSSRLISLNEGRETQHGLERIPRVYESSIEVTPALIERIAGTIAPPQQAVGGPVASMETLYKDEQARDLLIRQFPDLVGGEMEAFACFPTTFPWLLVKAVSDLGDSGFNRDSQHDAARRAAEALPHLLTVLADEGYLPEDRMGEPVTLLEDLMAGNAITLFASELRPNNLNDVLNDRIGRLLTYKLGRYVSDTEYGVDFPRLMCAVILEIMQNAIKHGKANETTVTLYPTKILLWDDGDAFDPATLSGQNGGARDWRAVRDRYLDTGEVQFTSKRTTQRTGNLYVFALPKASVVLRNARENCRMQIVPETVGAVFGRRPIFRFDDNCQVLYYRAEDVRMSSRRIGIADAIRKVVLDGRKVFLGCPSEHEAVLFKEELADIVGEKLVVFVDAR